MDKSRLMNGLYSGLFAGIVSNIYSFIVFLLNLTTLRYVDWAAIIIFGHKAKNVLDLSVALLGQLFFSILLGLVFAYLIPKISSQKQYLLKGWFYGILAYLVSYAVTSQYKAPELVTIPLKTLISNFVNASIFGLILAIVFKYLQNKKEDDP